MDKSGQIHAPAALILRKSPVHIKQNAGAARSRSGCFGEEQVRIYARATGRQIFRGGILKKSRLNYGMRKKRLSTREKFTGDLY